MSMTTLRPAMFARAAALAPALAFALAWVSACGPLAADDSADEPINAATGVRVARIVSGRAVAAGADPAVLCLWKPSMLSCASGTLIAPRVALVAAHSTAGLSPHELRVYFGNAPKLGSGAGIWVDVVAKHENPEADIALVELADSAPTTPMRLGVRTLEPSDIDRRARVVGFGATASDMLDHDIKRSGDTRIAALSDAPQTAPGSKWVNKGYIVYFGDSGGAKTCFGDSGGPLLAKDEAGVERVIGVASFGSDFDCAKGRSGAVRIDRERAWIDAKLLLLDPRSRELEMCDSTAVDSDCCAADGHCNAKCERDPDCAAMPMLPNPANAGDGLLPSVEDAARGCSCASAPVDTPPVARLVGGLAAWFLLALLLWATARRRRGR